MFTHANKGKGFSNRSERGKPSTRRMFRQSLFQKELRLHYGTKKKNKKEKMNWILLVTPYDVQPYPEICIDKLVSVQCIEFELCFIKHAVVIKLVFRV